MKTTIFTATIPTPLDEVTVYATDKGVCFLKFADQAKSEQILQQILKTLDATLHEAENPPIRQARQELDQYFSGTRRDFQTPLDIIGTDFQKAVWNVLQTIHYGTTLSYGDEARQLNREKSVRAVANANGRNRISIMIPCHRVIGSNGALTGYAGGLARKKWLLNFEQKVLAKGQLD